MKSEKNLIFYIYFFFIILFKFSVKCDGIFCDQLDFNVPVLTEIIECQQYLETFTTKKYSDTTEIKPPQPTLEYYLTYLREGISCGKTKTIFKINEFTEIQIGFYFKSSPGSFLKFHVRNAANENIYSHLFEPVDDDWFEWKANPNTIDDSSTIVIDVQSNIYNVLAVQYLRVLNSEKGEEECKAPISTTTTEATTTTTEATTTTTTEDTTTTTETTTTTTEPTTTTTQPATTTTSSTTTLSTESSTISIPIQTTTESNPILLDPLTSWEIVSIVFITIFCLLTVIAFYFCIKNQTYLGKKNKTKY